MLHGGTLTQQRGRGFVSSGAVEFVKPQGLHGALLPGGPVDGATNEFNLNLRHDFLTVKYAGETDTASLRNLHRVAHLVQRLKSGFHHVVRV